MGASGPRFVAMRDSVFSHLGWMGGVLRVGGRRPDWPTGGKRRIEARD
jgi:hypothetical protein